MKLLLCIGLLWSPTLSGQAISLPVAPIPPMGSFAASTLPSGAFTRNPAVLGFTESAGISITTSRPFGLSELSQAEISGFFPAAGGGIGMAWLGTGYSDYLQQQLQLSYGIRTGRSSMGISLTYQRLKIRGLTPQHWIAGSWGCTWKLQEMLSAGILIRNLLPGFWAKEKKNYLPVSYCAGICYSINPLLIAEATLALEPETEAQLAVQLQYRLPRQFQVGAGFTTARQQSHLTLGWIQKRLLVIVGSSVHPQLGLSPLLAIHYSPSQKNNDE